MVYAVIPKEKFDLIWSWAQSCPTFLCALPRREGYEFFVGQWTGTELHFTALINIQVGVLCSSPRIKKVTPLWDCEPLLRLEDTEYLLTASSICFGVDELLTLYIGLAF